MAWAHGAQSIPKTVMFTWSYSAWAATEERAKRPRARMLFMADPFKVSMCARLGRELEIAEVEGKADTFAAPDGVGDVPEEWTLHAALDGHVFEDGQDRWSEPERGRAAVRQIGSVESHPRRVLSGELNKTAIIPLVVASPQSSWAIAIDRAPRDGIRALGLVSFGEPGIPTAQPQVVATRGDAGHHGS